MVAAAPEEHEQIYVSTSKMKRRRTLLELAPAIRVPVSGKGVTLGVAPSLAPSRESARVVEAPSQGSAGVRAPASSPPPTGPVVPRVWGVSPGPVGMEGIDWVFAQIQKEASPGGEDGAVLRKVASGVLLMYHFQGQVVTSSKDLGGAGGVKEVGSPPPSPYLDKEKVEELRETMGMAQANRFREQAVLLQENLGGLSPPLWYRDMGDGGV